MTQKEVTVIQGDSVSSEEIRRQVDQALLNHLKLEREKIRVGFMPTGQKEVALSTLSWKIRAAEERLRVRS